MKYILLAFITLSTYMYSTTANANTCPVGQTEKDFEAYAAKNNFKMFVLSEEAEAKFLSYINTLRAKAGAEPIVADKINLAALNKDNAGIVMFKDGCVVPGTVLVVTIADAIEFMKKAGISETEISEVFSI